jgi:hypothetical protein
MQKKVFAQKVFGSNLFLENKQIVSTPQTQWAAIAAARKTYTENPECFNLVYPYNLVRTYFTANA